MATVSKTQDGQGTTAPPVPQTRRVSVPDFLAAKEKGTRLTVLTAYDCAFARLVESAGVDCILVGDSLGMVIQGNEDSLTVTLDEVIYHTRCVARGCRRALLVADMPFMTYQVSSAEALRNAGRLVQEGGAHAVKLEGGVRSAERIAAITEAAIPVMGHIGLTPQSVRQLGGFRVQRDEDQLWEDALAVEKAGAFALVIECVPADLARKITEGVRIPTIGIGAGAACDGQVLVIHDILGIFQEFQPRFVKRFANLGEEVVRAAESFCREVRDGTFPAPQHTFR